MIGAIAGGVLGTLVLSTLLRVAAEMGHTRMDLALILGTTLTTNRRRARIAGYALHLAIGILFAFVYNALFVSIGYGAWWLGALFGAIHALFLATVVMNVLLPAIHPLMGTPDTAANAYALIEPPGFLLRNYGSRTLAVMLVSHMAFGAIVGWAARI